MASTGEQTEIRYAQILAERLPAEMLEPVPGRALWVPVNLLIIAICIFAIINLQLNIILNLTALARNRIFFLLFGPTRSRNFSWRCC